MDNNTNNKICTKETSSCDITSLPAVTTTTMAYIPFQLDLSYYEPARALCRGTLFCDLDKPFKGRCTC